MTMGPEVLVFVHDICTIWHSTFWECMLTREHNHSNNIIVGWFHERNLILIGGLVQVWLSFQRRKASLSLDISWKYSWRKYLWSVTNHQIFICKKYIIIQNYYYYTNTKMQDVGKCLSWTMKPIMGTTVQVYHDQTCKYTQLQSHCTMLCETCASRWYCE